MLKFRKYHGLGNDFIIVRGGADALNVDEVARLCHRHRGVGADGVLLIRPGGGDEKLPTVEMVIYNRDGSRPEMCGNGVRCVAAFARHHWQMGHELVVLSDAGPRHCRIEDSGDMSWQVSVNMGKASVQLDAGVFDFEGQQFAFNAVDIGNPHAVVFADATPEIIEAVGQLANDDHPFFPQGVNVEFVIPSNEENAFEVVVYERGVGFTQACGTGACAVAVALWESGRASRADELNIGLPGGPLMIANDGGELWMTGEAVEVFRGNWSQLISDH